MFPPKKGVILTDMNKGKLKKSIYHRIRIRPVAKRFDGQNYLAKEDDDWIIQKVEDIVELSNVRTGHVAKLGFDHIHHYVSDPDRDFDGLTHGILELNVQLTLSGVRIEYEPIRRG